MIEHKVLGDMQPSDIVGKYKEVRYKHYDGHIRRILYTDIETPFPEGKMIVSLTDLDGYITQANKVFVEMSGYSEQELLGSPHYILRHPDMPPVAFKGLWDDLKEKGKWTGYVKNLRKDGVFIGLKHQYVLTSVMEKLLDILLCVNVHQEKK